MLGVMSHFRASGRGAPLDVGQGSASLTVDVRRGSLGIASMPHAACRQELADVSVGSKEKIGVPELAFVSPQPTFSRLSAAPVVCGIGLQASRCLASGLACLLGDRRDSGLVVLAQIVEIATKRF
jgi:hypothetical protein